MSEPTPAVLTGPQKAIVAAVLGTLATILGVVAPLVPEPWSGIAYALAGLVAVIGVPWGVYVTVNKPQV